jgi:hypothetical protein
MNHLPMIVMAFNCQTNCFNHPPNAYPTDVRQTGGSLVYFAIPFGPIFASPFLARVTLEMLFHLVKYVHHE